MLINPKRNNKALLKLIPYIKQNNLRVKMVLINLLITLLPLILFQIVFINIYFNTVQKNISNNHDIFFNNVSRRLNEYVNSVNKTSIQLFLNNDFQDDVVRELQAPHWSNRLNLTKRLAGFNLIDDRITGAAFFTLDEPSVVYTASINTDMYDTIRRTIDETDSIRSQPYRLIIIPLFDENGQINANILAIRRIMKITPSLT